MRQINLEVVDCYSLSNQHFPATIAVCSTDFPQSQVGRGSISALTEESYRNRLSDQDQYGETAVGLRCRLQYRYTSNLVRHSGTEGLICCLVLARTWPRSLSSSCSRSTPFRRSPNLTTLSQGWTYSPYLFRLAISDLFSF